MPSSFFSLPHSLRLVLPRDDNTQFICLFFLPHSKNNNNKNLINSFITASTEFVDLHPPLYIRVCVFEMSI